MASGHLLLSCAKRAATTKIDLFAYLWQLPCALCSLNLNDIAFKIVILQNIRDDNRTQDENAVCNANVKLKGG